MAVKNRLREVLKKKGISQTELANMLSVSKGTISNIINEKSDPSLEVALDMSKFLNLSVNEIFYKLEDKAEEDFYKILSILKELKQLSEVDFIDEEVIFNIFKDVFVSYILKYNEGTFGKYLSNFASDDEEFFDFLNGLIKKYVFSN